MFQVIRLGATAETDRVLFTAPLDVLGEILNLRQPALGRIAWECEGSGECMVHRNDRSLGPFPDARLVVRPT